MKEELIIVNHIGTSVIEAVEKELMALAEEIRRDTMKDTVLSFNSRRAILKLKSKGLLIPSLDEVIESAIGKYERVTILTLHLVGGSDYEMVLEKVASFEGKLNIRVICPLLKDKEAFDAVLDYTHQIQERAGCGFLIVVHGTSHESNDLYLDLFRSLKLKNDHVYLLSLLDDVHDQMAKLPEKMYLFPLFTVTGHHVQKDLFDSEESIYKTLIKSNKEVAFWRNGLLLSPEIRAIYIKLIKKH